MRVFVIGATGTIGSAIVTTLAARHEVVTTRRTHGSFHLDLASPDSIAQLYQSVGKCDAVVSAAGIAKFAGLDQLTYEDYFVGLTNKLMGRQINLARLGQPFLSDGGSFTLTSGILSREPMKGSASISMVNAGLEGFVRATALEHPRGLRINVGRPPWVTETLIVRGMDPSIGIPAAQVALAYMASVEGSAAGQTIDPRMFAAP